MRESLSILLVGVIIISCEKTSMKNTNPSPVAPIAEVKPKSLNYLGKEFIDNYYWLREKESEEVINYLKAENDYTTSMMKHTEELQNDLYEEIKSRIKEKDMSVPVFEDGYYYYSRTEEGKQYSIYCRKKGSLDALEEVLLDGNVLAKGKEYFKLGEFAISPNNNILAYSADYNGSESYTIYIKDLETGKLAKETIPDSYYGLEWANDNEHFFYTKFDNTHRPYQLWRHRLGTAGDKDVLVFEELDESFFLGIDKSKDDSFLFLDLGSQITSEVHYLDANKPEGEFKVIQPKLKGVEYSVEHFKGDFYILTNSDGAQNFKLVKAPTTSPSKNNWEPVFPYDKNRYLRGFEPFENYFVISERVNGQTSIRILDNKTMEDYDLPFDEPAYSVSLGDNPTFRTSKLRLYYGSLATPQTVFDYDLVKKEFKTLKVQEVPGGYDSKEYVSERIFAKAKDGAEIPISLVYKKGFKHDGAAPCYLYAYGSYGANMDPYFSVSRLSLLDRGFVFAMVNTRGGSEKGRQWYEDGKFLNKKNTFTDFITAADHLIAENYTSAEKMIANGGSAGGLLMGAVANMGGDRFNTIVADVPFVDVINTMMDEDIPLTVIEYDEWGNPNQQKYFDYMMSYSPYDNVEAKEYPNLLITAGLNDPRVQYWEPAKWASGRFDRLKEVALEYAFLLDNLNKN